MPDELILVGASHTTAPIEVRERLRLSVDEIAARAELRESFVLSTCCRTELYAVARDADEAEQLLSAELGDAHRACGRAVAQHLLRVASGLESIALGEVEILGQLRRAGEAADAAGTRGRTLGRLVDHALATGRRVRRETELAVGRSSIASVAVGLARRHLGPRATGLVVGRGEMGAKAARALRAAGLVVTVVSGRGAGPEGLLDPLSETDVVVSCTGAPHQLVSAGVLAGLAERRRGRELLVIDLAVPRDFDPAARAVEGVRFYDLDDLEGDVDATAGRRRAAIPAAEAIVAHEVDRFMRWMAGLGVVPTIKDLRGQSELAVLEALRRSDLAAGAEEDLLRATSKAIVSRLLHAPTLRLREAAGRGDADVLARSVRELFQLDPPRAAA
jgi:glutamyl-tRNA reductase